MIYLKCLIGSLLLWAGIVSCSNDDENKEENYVKVYNGTPANGNEVGVGDTISLKLFSTVKLYIETNYDSLFVIGDENNIELTRLDHNVYRCAPICIGRTDVVIVPASAEATTRYVHFKTTSYSKKYTIIKNTYTVNTTSTVAEYNILDELKQDYIPAVPSIVNFEYATSEKGDFTYESKEGKITSGTFTAIGGKYDVTVGSSTLSFTLETGETSGYVLTQDLTKEFQEKYPSLTINKVMITSQATGN